MIVVIHLTADEQIGADAERALAVLANRPGYLSGTAGPAADDPASWVLVTQWRTVGDYRRALGNYDVKLYATPLLARAIDLPSAFEQTVSVDSDGTVHHAASDRFADGEDTARR
ncbi:MAG: antibiotic biosynthesis monooxygenase [Jatrophihabitans sp.]